MSDSTDHAACTRAAEILRNGGLVAFPTETVYGLGADARNINAVRKIFEVKGRPETHPLIVHIASATQLSSWAATVPDTARRLAERFWPGPLTLILTKHESVPLDVTGGQDTVGLRVPAHPLALNLLTEFGGGIAAPSANRFGRVSPTTATHVRDDLGKDVDFILDGGPCSVGVESTIVNLSSGRPTILRPGGVTREEIEEVLGCNVPVQKSGEIRVSGSLPSHYAPQAEVRIVGTNELATYAASMKQQGIHFEILQPDAHTLYAAMRDADQRGVQVILTTLPPDQGLGLAIQDRLRRAAGQGHQSD